MKNFLAGDDGDQNYGDDPDSDHSGDDDRKDDDNNLDRFPASLAKANGLGTPTNNTLIATVAGEELHGRRRHQGDLDLGQAVRC